MGYIQKYLSIISILFTPKIIQAKDLGENFSLYGKLSMAAIGQAGVQSLNNNSSRFGFKYERDDLLEGFTTGLRAEFGINTSNTSQSVQEIPNTTGRFQVDNTSDRPFSTRLTYLSLSKGDFEATIGKNWSVWYDISGLTDIFMVTGAFASSTYTSNGEVIGTSRGVDLVQLRYKLGNIHLGAQAKLTGDESTDITDSAGNVIGQLVLEHSIAASIRYITKNIILGAAAINLITDSTGKDISETSVSVGARYIYKEFFTAFNYADAKDLELVDGNFIRTDDFEGLIGWNITKRHQLMIGYNWQNSDEVNYEDYEMSYYLASYIYRYDQVELGLELVFDDSTEPSGERPENHQVILGATLYF
ncbi:porin [Halobacteriovorax sp.]|uniref:porin n=1 Tax=Halobacteriovorax sp. TaxID=2020862 RepID=UPI003AF2AB6A